MVARGIRPAAVLIVLLAALGLPAAAVAEPPAGAPPTITLSDGKQLAPGTYTGTVVIKGRAVPVTVVVPAPPGAATTPAAVPTASQPPPASAPVEAVATQPASAPGTGLGGQLLTGLVLLLLAAGGVTLYLRVLAPRRYRRPYRRALDQIEARRYDLALPALTRLESALPEHVRVEARFFIAFAMYRLDDRRAAEHRLAELHREQPGHVEVAYLLAQLRADRRDFDGAEQALEALDPAVRDAHDKVRKLYGVVTVQRAFAAFRQGRIDAAAELFEKVERLGDFAVHVPVDLRNRNILLGTRALAERDVPTAREHFESLHRAAEGAEGAARAALTASAELGLALGAWLSKDDASAEETQRRLTAALLLLDPDGPAAVDWPDKLDERDLAAHIEEMERRATREGHEIEHERTLRDIHFLCGMAVLREWSESDPRFARDGARDFLERATGRFARARELDPEFSDTYVVVGLLRYYLATDQAGRQAGVAVLREAQKLGTRDPEVLQILNHDERVRRANRDAAEAFLQILDQYVQDVTVRGDVRSALLERMSRYAKVRGWDTRPEVLRRREVMPTIAERQARAELLLSRVADLQGNAGTVDLSGAHQLTRNLEQQTRQMAEFAQQVENREAELLAMLGDTLLSELESQP